MVLARRIAVAGMATSLLLTGCSSSGGGGVNQSQLESKIKKEPQIQTLLSQGGKKAKLTDALVGCIAKALKKDADPSDLKKYVQGKLDINDVGGKSKGSASKAKTDVQTCAQNVASSASASPSS